jgi:2,4-dienoyl-CoA reductase-like NADH-dependent reductase (Old Yellow Enzyme family)
MNLRHVLKPIKLGPVSIPNRVARTGHGTGLGGGTISQALIDYHVARAKGGVGLTILEVIAVNGSAYPFLVAGAPGLVKGYRALMDAVRPYGMKVFQQIGNPGNEAPQADGSPPLSSSDSVGALLGIQAEPMSKAQIKQLIDSYVAAARDCVAGGLDGIELHMAHGYLIQQFMSPLYNARDDEYGGSFENRLRLPLELLAAVRAAIPEHMALGVRLSAELLPGGVEPDDVALTAKVFEEQGLIDFLDLTIGTDYNPHKVIGAMHEPAGYELPYDAPPKRAVKLPVLVTGRFRTLEDADQVIASGAADLVALTRAHIADPDIVRKTIEDRVDQIRPCIGCNHGCIGGLLTLGRIGCAVNVAAGNEATLAEELIQPTRAPKMVLVAGGGPAGLEAARVAALTGHRVILAEAAKALGGCVNIAKRAPRRMGIGDITDWLEREVYRLGVDVRLNTYIQAEDVWAIAPDVVIVATGSLPRLDGRQHLSQGHVAAGMNQPHVVSSHEVLLEKRDWGKHALVFDDTGHYEAVAAAEHLIEQGISVTFVAAHASFASRLEASLSADPALERLARGNFRLITHGRLISVGARHAQVAQRFGGAPEDIPADTVVFVSHNACNRELTESLQDWPGRLLTVGDARSPRYLQTAIREGHLAARSIE